MSKLKILMCSEASFINSGFGIYTKELLTRMHNSNKYEVAEFASYGFVNDPRDFDIHWKYYANAVKENDPRHREYSARMDNQFGRWRFEKVLLDFKPDVVIDIRDYWMSSYQRHSPLRSHFHWILMPTVDSSPQQDEWIDTFMNADAVFTYSDWGAETINNQSSNKINYIDTVSPGVDLNIFRIKDSNLIKQQYGLPENSIIVGSVMRNQKRKLIPELFQTFRMFLDKLEADNQTELGRNVYLYLHTSYPDMGWDIPELLRESRLANKVLFTYLCKHCKSVSCNKFCGPQKMCTKCFHKASTLTSVTHGLTQDQLSDIYNTFDLYVQYSICEGFGMPQVEAGACGVPIACVDYSAMTDIIKKLNAYPIKIKTYFKELETKAIRVYPDNEDLADYLYNFLLKPKPIREKERKEISALTHKYYNWDDCYKKWETYLDKLDSSGYRANWHSSIFLQPVPKIDNNNNFETLVRVLNDNLQNLKLLGSYPMLDILNNSDYQFIQNGISIGPYSSKNMIEHINTIIQNHNVSKEANDGLLEFDEDFISYAHLKEKS